MNRFHKFFLLLLSSACLRAQVPTATIVPPSGTLCTGVTYSFVTTTSNSPTGFSWSISPTLSVTITPDRTSSFINLNFGRSGVYTLSLQVTNAATTSIVSRTVAVTQNAVAAFNASLNATGYPSQMNLTNYSAYYTGIEWLFSDAPSDTQTNTVKTYTASGNYTISLIAYGANACNDTSSYSFRIADSSGITLPNIFTPNRDSVNDVFKPIARGITEMKAWIFNRYGTLIYQWDKPAGYWDGYTSSGEPCSPDVYFCVLEATGFDGKSYKLKTKVTLLR